MRYLREAWPFALAIVALSLVIAPGAGEPGVRAIAVAIVAVGLTFAAARAYFRSRIEPLVKVAEQLAAGGTDVAVPAREDPLGRRLSAAVTSLVARVARAEADASTDRLTGVPNRVGIVGVLFNEVERSVRYRRPLAVVFADIDHFKTVNDTYGHEAGDLVLRAVADVMRRHVRTTDHLGRYGGEEFMLVLPETTVDDAAGLADKLRLVIAGERIPIGNGNDLAVTMSFGITGGIGDRLSVDALVREADGAMYSAKALGRDQVYAFVAPSDDSAVLSSPISPSGRATAFEVGRRAHGAAAEALAAIISPLPHYRGQPSALIATIVSALAASLDLPAHEVDRIRVAALLHDVGKVGISQEILEKPAPLTAAEWRSVTQHPRIGQVILEHASTLRDAVPIILHHHERFGGAGYPHGLRGNEIPLGARIVAIADAYDAMINDRPYKGKITHEQAVEELRAHAGTQFDPELVELFCDIYGQRAPEADPAALGFVAAVDSHRTGRRRAAG